MHPFSTIIGLIATLVVAFASPLTLYNDRSLDPDYIKAGFGSHLKPRLRPHGDLLTPANHIGKRTNVSSTYPQTNFTFSDTSITWGCNIDPVATLGNLSSICPSTGNTCLSSEPYSLAIGYTTASPKNFAHAPVPETLQMSASGNYPSAMHDELIEAIQKAVSANGLVQWTRGQEWAYSDETDSPKGGTMEQYTGECDLASFSNEIAITVWSEEGSLDASMDIVMSLPDLDDGFCAILEGPVGLTAAIVGLIPGGSTLAGFLGLIGAACGVTSG